MTGRVGLPAVQALLQQGLQGGTLLGGQGAHQPGRVAAGAHVVQEVAALTEQRQGRIHLLHGLAVMGVALMMGMLLPGLGAVLGKMRTATSAAQRSASAGQWLGQQGQFVSIMIFLLRGRVGGRRGGGSARQAAASSYGRVGNYQGTLTKFPICANLSRYLKNRPTCSGQTELGRTACAEQETAQ